MLFEGFIQCVVERLTGCRRDMLFTVDLRRSLISGRLDQLVLERKALVERGGHRVVERTIGLEFRLRGSPVGWLLGRIGLGGIGLVFGL